jgi:hypothetical protein
LLQDWLWPGAAHRRRRPAAPASAPAAHDHSAPAHPAGRRDGQCHRPRHRRDGVRHTIVVDTVAAQRVWNFRSAWNVAALNCTAPEYADITTEYRTFLKKHAKALAVANRSVDTLFRQKYGKVTWPSAKPI